MKSIYKLLALLLFMGCSDDPPTQPDEPNQQNTEVAENVQVISADNSELVSTETELERGIYKIEFSTDVPDLEVNDIIVGDEGEGYLRKIEALEVSGRTITTQTSQATLDDVFNDASLVFNTDISGSRMANISQRTEVNYLTEGVSISNNGLQFNFSNTVLYQGAFSSITITNGTATFNPNFAFDADYSLLGGLEYLDFKTNNANLVINCNLDYTATDALTLPEYTKTLADYDKILTVVVGGVPVVVVVNTELVAKINAQSESSLSFLSSWTNTYGLTTGVNYANDSWTGNFDLDTSLTIHSMDFEGQVNLSQSLQIVPIVKIKFFGVIGPYCEPALTENLTFNIASPSADWDADLQAGLELKTGVDVTVLGTTLVDFSRTDTFMESIWNAPTKLTKESGDNQDGEKGEPLEEPLKVLVTDVLDNPMPLVNVYFSLAEGEGELSEEKVKTDENGYAEVSWTLGEELDEQSVEAVIKKADGSEIGSSLVFTANAGVPSYQYPETGEFGTNILNDSTSYSGEGAYSMKVILSATAEPLRVKVTGTHTEWSFEASDITFDQDWEWTDYTGTNQTSRTFTTKHSGAHDLKFQLSSGVYIEVYEHGESTPTWTKQF